MLAGSKNLLSLDMGSVKSAFSAVATCLNNVGPVGNFSSLSDVSKLVLSFDMLAGRLEIFPMLLLFAPSQ